MELCVLSAYCWWGQGYGIVISQRFHKDIEEMMPLYGFLRDLADKAFAEEDLLLPLLFMVISAIVVFDNQFLISWLYISMLVVSFSGGRGGADHSSLKGNTVFDYLSILPLDLGHTVYNITFRLLNESMIDVYKYLT